MIPNKNLKQTAVPLAVPDKPGAPFHRLRVLAL
jgi:hypothetical protein